MTLGNSRLTPRLWLGFFLSLRLPLAYFLTSFVVVKYLPSGQVSKAVFLADVNRAGHHAVIVNRCW